MITIKEYAEKHGKSKSAVYQQLNSKSNKEKLKGHIQIRKINGKKTKFLDEIAESVLDQASMSDKVVLTQADNRDQIEALKKENDRLRQNIIDLQTQLLKERELLIAEKDKNTKLLEQQTKSKGFLSRLFGSK